MNCITFLFDKISPIFHKLTQRHQWVFRYGELVVSTPGFHGNQDYPGVELFLINLAQQQNEQTPSNSVSMTLKDIVGNKQYYSKEKSLLYPFNILKHTKDKRHLSM